MDGCFNTLSYLYELNYYAVVGTLSKALEIRQCCDYPATNVMSEYLSTNHILLWSEFGQCYTLLYDLIG